MADQHLTKEILNFLFDYKDGQLIWKFTLGSKSPKGNVAGSLRHDGYIKVGISGKIYLIHRLIFMYHHGYFPEYVDHINRNRQDNRIENLRAANKSQNCQNAKTPKSNVSGIKNVSWSKKLKKWRVQLRVKRQTINVGYFKDLELAELVAQEARTKHHKEFASHF